MSSVAVIDIGSNSIKALLALRSDSGRLENVHTRTIDARISAGISQAEPRLTEEGMHRGLAAVQLLLADLAPHRPGQTVLVATSAVRDAQNGDEFRERVHSATGHTIRILSGEEEANLIGRGLTCDPALQELQNFYVFDLGGGSLECLSFRTRRVQRALSLPLGCVRLTEKFVPDAAAPLSASVLREIATHTQTQLLERGFTFEPGPQACAVGTGGTLTTVRSIRAAKAGATLDQTDPLITLAELRALRDELAALPLETRRRVPGLPPPRADVFPTALATLAAVADAGQFTAFRHSLYNLRWGLAAELLD